MFGKAGVVKVGGSVSPDCGNIGKVNDIGKSNEVGQVDDIR